MTTHRISRPTVVGLDLTSTGAPRAWASHGDAEAEAFIMSRLSGLASLSDNGGVDLIALDAAFRLGSGRRRDDWLDGALAASRLGRHTSRLTVAASIPLGVTDAEHVASAVASIQKGTQGRAAWQVEGSGGRGIAAGAVTAVLDALATPRISRRTGNQDSQRPQVVVNVREPLDLEIAAARADIARIRVASLEEAIATRANIRQAAQEWGRHPDDVQVLVDVHAVLGADDDGARARADLLTLLEEDERREENLLEFVGTSVGLATLWQAWVEAGAADGFTLIPASVPTDVLALVTEVVGELTRRGLRAPIAAEPVDRPAVPQRAARRRRVQVGV